MNGLTPDEPVFAAPWEARAFALVVALEKSGRLAWPEFQRRLVAEIQASEAPGAERRAYYENWLRAAERLLDETGLAPEAERAGATPSPPPGHDHHGHTHDHDHHGHDHNHDHDHDHALGIGAPTPRPVAVDPGRSG